MSATPAEPFAALKREPAGSLEFWGNKQPKCPHCGHEVGISKNDLWRLYEEGEHELECPDCEGAFIVWTRVSYSFDTDSQEGA